MRTHAAIITKPLAVAEALIPHLPAGRWRDALALSNTVKAWKRNSSIPGEYWPAMERAGLATVAELAHAAEAKRLTQSMPGEAAA